VPLDHNKHQPPNTQTARPSGSRRLRPLCARRCPSGAAHALCLSLSRNHMTAAPKSIAFHDRIAHLSPSSPPPLRAQRHEQQVLHATDRWLTTTHHPLSLHRPPSVSVHRDPTRTRTRHTDSQPPPDRRMPRRRPHAHPTPTTQATLRVHAHCTRNSTTIALGTRLGVSATDFPHQQHPRSGPVHSSPKHRNLTATSGSKGASLTAIESVEQKPISTLLRKVS
jgi:hypothetical protein